MEHIRRFGVNPAEFKVGLVPINNDIKIRWTQDSNDGTFETVFIYVKRTAMGPHLPIYKSTICHIENVMCSESVRLAYGFDSVDRMNVDANRDKKLSMLRDANFVCMIYEDKSENIETDEVYAKCIVMMTAEEMSDIICHRARNMYQTGFRANSIAL